MKKNVVCYKCGKKYKLNIHSISQTICCDHCHAYMTFDYPSIRKLKIVRYVLILMIVLPIVLGFQMINSMNNYSIIILTCIIAVALSLWSDKFCLYIAYKFMDIHYIECHPENKKKITKVKKQKGRKKWILQKD